MSQVAEVVEGFVEFRGRSAAAPSRSIATSQQFEFFVAFRFAQPPRRSLSERVVELGVDHEFRQRGQPAPHAPEEDARADHRGKEVDPDMAFHFISILNNAISDYVPSLGYNNSLQYSDDRIDTII
mgnify:CR=1 FL=1